MKIDNYAESLLPVITKERILEDIRITRGELTDGASSLTNVYADAAVVFKDYKFKNAEVARLANTFTRTSKLSLQQGSVIGTISQALRTISANLEEVEKLITETYSTEVTASGMTYAKANLLQFVDYAGFVAKFSRRFLMYIYANEIDDLTKGDLKARDSFSPAEAKWVKDNFLAFSTAFSVVATNTNEVRRALSDIPEIVITKENAQTLPSTIGDRKIDPLAMRFVPISWNPIYKVRLLVAEWQANRYKAAKEELRLLEMRRLQFTRLLDGGKRNAQVEKEIEVLEGRISNLNYVITKAEKDNQI